jgi:hypothetical protein
VTLAADLPNDLAEESWKRYLATLPKQEFVDLCSGLLEKKERKQLELQKIYVIPTLLSLTSRGNWM